jgi:hypothetical protein
MYPEVEEYFKIEAEAKDAYATGEMVALERYEEAGRTASNRDERNRIRMRYNAVTNALQNMRDGTINLAWANLQDSDDKLVAFIARNCGGYRNDSEPYALVILRMLPASLDQIKKTAIEGNWCNVFDNFMAQALQEGVIEDTRSQARKDLERWVNGNFGGRYWSSTLEPLVNKVLEQEAEAFVAVKNGTAPVPPAKGATSDKAPAVPVELDPDDDDDEPEF